MNSSLRIKQAYVAVQDVTNFVYLVELLGVLRTCRAGLFATAETWKPLHAYGFCPRLVVLIERVRIEPHSLLIVNGPQRESGFVRSVARRGDCAVLVDQYDYPKVERELRGYLGRISAKLCQELAERVRSCYGGDDAEKFLFG